MVRKDIKHVRGDTFSFDLTISGIENVTVESIYFSARSKISKWAYAFQKSIGDGITLIDTLKYRVRLAPEDTATLAPGDYDYDLQIGLGADIWTVMGGNFTLIKDVTEETT